jgi:hypothetical protein
MRNLAAVNSILEHQVERATGEFLAAVRGPVGAGPKLAPYPCIRKLVLERVNRFERKIAPVNADHGAGLAVVDDQLAFFCVVTKRRHAAHPHALLLGGGDLVAHTLANDLGLKLREGQQHVQRQSPHAGGGDI